MRPGFDEGHGDAMRIVANGILPIVEAAIRKAGV
jgi:hypothetical protein